MNMRDLYDALEGIMWTLDGNLWSTDLRTPAWFAECDQILELARHRAYDLATTTKDPEVHNIQEYVRPVDVSVKRMAVDSDADMFDLNLGELMRVEKLKTTKANLAFVWDMNSMLSHMDLMLHGMRAIQIEKREISVTALRQRVMDEVASPALWTALLDNRKAFEYELCCNEADFRIHARKNPLRKNPTAFGVLGYKKPCLVDDPVFPESYDAMFSDTNAPAMYRMNTDAALCFMTAQSYQNVVKLLILDKWETLPPLTNPRIIRIRALNCWGVVEAWPKV